MTHLIAAPEMMVSAATNAVEIGSAITAAGATAAGSTTNVLAAAADEVSAAIAKLFGTYGQQLQAALTQATAFHDQFVQTLAGAATTYAQAEAANAAAVVNALGGINAQVQSLLAPAVPNAAAGPTVMAAAAPAASTVALVMGGTFDPEPFPLYVSLINNAYIQPFFPGANPTGVSYPAQLWPLSIFQGNLTLNESVAQGMTDLTNAINSEIGSGNPVVNFGFSQSAVVSTNVITELMALPPGIRPDPSQLSFVLAGNPATPNGGFFTRFPGITIPWLDITFTEATPPNSPYPTTIYATQYDPASDFPRYPLNFLADLNALMSTGRHELYPILAVNDAVPLPTSPGYNGNTQYYMFMTKDLPLLDPLRAIPIVGEPLAELIQPNLRVLVDLGYSDWGNGQDYANVVTPASLFSIPDPFVVGRELADGTVKGIQASLVEIGALPQSALPNEYPYLPALDTDVNFYVGQPTATDISLLTRAVGPLLDLVPPIHHMPLLTPLALPLIPLILPLLQ
ncbi:PE family protein [Mycobacterium persicum]|uniref:PE family protein PE3 n=1 Tax=Mycobacterium persicum TaxID=1487726 RepID=A0A1X0LAN3_9MYCO|nr:PE-PPE domain-containing protein [Mycobacterium persicum]ORB49197.1 PE-PGRS family protein [Mycobacterium persicum]ORB90401.1 PE-PGRS family protein [Mycobacterium persicum]ORB95816.1 PE-PGRS family protein [Mycobacterium persicum]ORC02525.1 PE-PGRS family protein [Mycobacterium persicum]ORC07791.1 PE-PGRS family protein [Mycobacterium persicum]